MLVSSTKARFRALGMLACFGLSAGCALEGGGGAQNAAPNAVGSVAQGLVSDVAVYTDSAPAAPWQSWSWSSAVDVANADAPLAAGSTSQIKTTLQTDYGALSLAYSTSDLTVSDYDAVSFDVRSDSSATVRVMLETLDGAASGVAVDVPITTSWTRQTLSDEACPSGVDADRLAACVSEVQANPCEDGAKSAEALPASCTRETLCHREDVALER